MESTFSIKDLSQLSRIKAHTLRIWEQRYGILNPSRTKTNIRYYSQDDLKYLLNVTILYDHGFKISAIAKLGLTELGEKVKKLSQHVMQYPSQIQGLVLAMIELDEDRFETQLNTDIEILGLQDTIENIVYPFLQQVGMLWLSNTINPAQEHFISNLIRQKLIVSIDALKKELNPTAKKFILYLPEGEFHEIGLLYIHYLIKLHGHKSIYLGQNLPLGDLLEVQRIHKADVIFTRVTSYTGSENLQLHFDQLSKHHPETMIWISGYQVVSQDLDTAKNFIKLDDLKKFKSLLKT